MPPMPSSGLRDDVAVLGMEGADLGRVTRHQRGRDEGGGTQNRQLLRVLAQPRAC